MLKVLIFLLLPFTCISQDTTFKHIYHLKRLQVIKADTTVTGKVIRVSNEIDGDWHVVLSPGIEVEFICQCRITVPDAATSCIGYGTKFIKPKVGQVITVSGPYVIDLHHGWKEIHPVKTLIIL